MSLLKITLRIRWNCQNSNLQITHSTHQSETRPNGNYCGNNVEFPSLQNKTRLLRQVYSKRIERKKNACYRCTWPLIIISKRIPYTLNNVRNVSPYSSLKYLVYLWGLEWWMKEPRETPGALRTEKAKRLDLKLYPEVTELFLFMSRRVKVYSGLHWEESLSRSQFHSIRIPTEPP